MNKPIFYIPGNQIVQRATGTTLKQNGYTIDPVPSNDVSHLLLPIPSFADNGQLRCEESLDKLLEELPKTITIIGGNLPDSLCDRYKTFDLLKDPQYLAENAYITACCALRLIVMELPVILRDCNILIIGWGRIAQCLASLLRAVGADVTLAIRNDSQRALAQVLGYRTVDMDKMKDSINECRVICNTAPANVISEKLAAQCNEKCLKIDLASKLGIEGRHVIWARGLPGKDAPESTGLLIAKTVIRLLEQGESK